MINLFVCFFLLFNCTVAFAGDRDDRNLYEKNKMRLQERDKREKARHRCCVPNDPNNPNYHRNYYYEHQYEEPDYYE